MDGAPAAADARPSRADAWLLQEAAIGVLRDVVGRCDAVGIPVLAVKGVVTSRLLYEDVTERPLTDVDIRVRGADFDRLRQLAADVGWGCVRVLRSYRSLIFDLGTLSLDVETYVGPPGLCSLEVGTMIARARRTELAPGLSVLTPEIHDHAVLLTINAFKDKVITAPAWALADLARIVVHPCFCQSDFVKRIGDSGIVTIAWIVARWFETVRGDRAWGDIRRAIESGTSVRRLYARVFRRYMRAADESPLALRLLARAGADRPWMRLRGLATALACSAEMRLRA
jgi:Uncharacterised nucleotidyltransferase